LLPVENNLRGAHTARNECSTPDAARPGQDPTPLRGTAPMKPKTMILMIVAVTCGLGASYMTSRLLAERGNQSDDTEKITVLVARKSLEMGSILKNPNELFEEKQFTKGEEPKNGLVDLTLLKGRQLKRPLRTGDYISEDDLFEKGKVGISGMLPEGHLAVGIKVTPDSVAGGFASLPHSRVD